MKKFSFIELGAVNTEMFSPQFIENFSAQIPTQLCEYIENEKYHKNLFKKLVFSLDHRTCVDSEYIVKCGKYYYIPMKISSRKHPLHIASCRIVWQALSESPANDLNTSTVNLKLYIDEENKKRLRNILPEIMRSIIY